MASLTCPHCGQPVEVFHRTPRAWAVESDSLEVLGEVPLDVGISRGPGAGPPPDAFREIATRLQSTKLATPDPWTPGGGRRPSRRPRMYHPLYSGAPPRPRRAPPTSSPDESPLSSSRGLRPAPLGHTPPGAVGAERAARGLRAPRGGPHGGRRRAALRGRRESRPCGAGVESRPWGRGLCPLLAGGKGPLPGVGGGRQKTNGQMPT